MSRFTVDAHSLRTVSSNLQDLGRVLGTIDNQVIYDASVVGGRVIEHALVQFDSTWAYGQSVVQGEIVTMVSQLARAAHAYEEIERRVQQGAHDHPVGTPPWVHHPHSHPHPHHHHHHHRHPRSGTGTTRIGGGGPRSGTGTTVIGGSAGTGGSGGSGRSGGPGGGSHGGTGTGTGTTIIGGPSHITVSSPLLTHGQEAFVGKLAALTGLSPRVVAAWALAEESSTAARQREADGDNNWLNIGWFDSGRGEISRGSEWDDPTTAAEQTAKFLEGDWGGASASIQHILDAGAAPGSQLDAIASSDWASSHYATPGGGPGSLLHATYDELSHMTVRGS